MNPRYLLAVIPLAAGALWGCGEDEPDANSTATTAAASSPASGEPATTTSESTAPDSTTTTTAPAPPELDGREFVSTEVVGFDLVPGSEIRLTFEGDRIGAAGGCNQLSSTWALEGDDVAPKLVVGDMASTMMACEPATLIDQDTWVSSFLTSDPTVALDGDTLTLTVGQSAITLVEEPDQTLEGPTWTFDSILSADAVTSVAVVRPPTLTFAAGQVGQVAVDTGCNTGSGPYEATATEITFGPIALTRMACDDATAQVEAAITTVLEGVVSYEIDADQLRLTKGDEGLVYRAS